MALEKLLGMLGLLGGFPANFRRGLCILVLHYHCFPKLFDVFTPARHYSHGDLADLVLQCSHLPKEGIVSL